MFSFRSDAQDFSNEIFCLSLDLSIEFSFQCFISVDFSSVDDCDICIVIDSCNQFSFELVYVVIEWFYLHSSAILNAGKSFSSFCRDTDGLTVSSLQCKALKIVITFLVHLKYSFLDFFFHLHLFDGVCFQYSLLFVSFFVFERSDLFLI